MQAIFFVSYIGTKRQRRVCCLDNVSPFLGLFWG
nr:MAG TPA: hypothetical protein [Caudoviricetes sp.]